jgi:ABC-type multidrug transport system fused ATPase/permease subunit
MSTIQNADIIIVLDKGRVIAQGTHGELVDDNQLYRRMYETQKVG